MKESPKNYYTNLKSKIFNKDFSVGIIGLGYVGLPLALTFAENNIKVIGFDINTDYLEKLRNGKSYIHHIPSKRISKQINNNCLVPTNDFKKISEVNVIIICVPTPLTKHREPDLKYIYATINNLYKYLKRGQLIVLESTTYPGTTDEVLKPKLMEIGFEIGEDFFLAYSPEREDPGNKNFNANNIPKILGGITTRCSDLGLQTYESVIDNVVVVSSTKVAEMTKLLENIHRAVNIGLVNELKTFCDSLNIDIYEVINAAATKPFGFTPFYPGPGLGGHCIPIDPYYLSWKAKEYGLNMKFIELAGEINSSMPIYIFNKLSNFLNSECKSIKNSKVLILGLSYKKNIDDLRESPSLEIIKLLLDAGAKVSYCDPYIKKLPKLRKYNYEIEGIKLNKKNLSLFDCNILTTDHDSFDYEIIKKNSKLLIDTRGKFAISSNVIRG